jgi:hypothetical protein
VKFPYPKVLSQKNDNMWDVLHDLSREKAKPISINAISVNFGLPCLFGGFLQAGDEN